MKRILALILAIIMLMTCALAETTEPADTAEATETAETTDATGTDESGEAAEADDGAHTIFRTEVKTYLADMDNWYSLPMCFVDGVDDLPWLDLEDFCGFMNTFQNNFWGDANYNLEYIANGDLVYLSRESGYFMCVDFNENTIFFSDYDGFVHDSSDKPLVDMVSANGFDKDGRSELFQRLPAGTYDRYGQRIQLELNDYGIQLIHQGDYYLVPAQTLSDFVLAISTGMNLFYNGDEAFCANSDLFGMVGSSNYPLTQLGERYYSGKQGTRSEALATYGYNELCLMLDKLYGLKELHDVTSFDRLFTQLGYKDDLMAADPTVADNKLYDFIDMQLDDIHSNFSGYSYLSGKLATEGRFGLMGRKLDSSFDFFKGLRQLRYPDGPVGYEEFGNTAYITFDTFYNNPASTYYENDAGDDTIPGDTIGLIIYAHKQIYREDSPVENVVIDLSCNSGGSLNAAAFVLGWVFGEGQVSLANSFSGANSTSIYRVDTNLDREFDINDQVYDKNIYCLISPCSFSCGNMVPAAFKASGQVTLLGRTSGGGSCLVLNMATAWGTYFEISGPLRMSFRKNGVFYDIDRGVEPDFVINNVSNFYDRQALTDYINTLF